VPAVRDLWRLRAGRAGPAAPEPPKKKEPFFVAAIVDGVKRYGRKTKWGLEEWTPTTKGDLRRTGNVWEIDESQMRAVVKWGKRVVGIAESFFPHPKEWRFDGLDQPLDQVSVKSFYRMLCEQARVEPSCLRAWEARVGPLPTDIGERYSVRLLTPRDWASHFKNVLHRALLTRSRSSGEPCRCCGFARENLLHFASCDKAGKIFSNLFALTDEAPLLTQRDRDRFALFALHPTARLKSVWVHLHLLLWEQLIALLVRIELEGDRFDEAQVWVPAWKRLESKILALKERVSQVVRRAKSRGDP